MRKGVRRSFGFGFAVVSLVLAMALPSMAAQKVKLV
jgi:hypothetical protein